MKFCKYLPIDCICCYCGKKIGHRSGYVLRTGKTLHEKCSLIIAKQQRDIEKQALKSFYNDKDAIKMLERKIEANKKRPKVIAKIRRALHALSPVMAKWQANQPRVDIEALKQIPISELYEGQLRKTGNILMGACPFHNEKHGSFTIYIKQNKWHCFGACGSGGSNIDFFMKLNSCDFKTAIRELNKI